MMKTTNPFNNIPARIIQTLYFILIKMFKDGIKSLP